MMTSSRKFALVLLLLLPLISLAAQETPEHPYFTTRVYFSDSLKFSNGNLDANIIDRFQFEGNLFWTEFTTGYARLKLDNATGSTSTVLFGAYEDQRYGEHNQVLLDVFYIESELSGELNWSGPVSLDLLVGNNAGGTLNSNWTVFDLENYRLGGIDGATVQADIGFNDLIYLNLAVNPAFGIDSQIWRGLTGTVTDGLDFLGGVSIRDESYWAELYWDSYANSVAFNQGTPLSLFGLGGWWKPSSIEDLGLNLFGRLEYGLSRIDTNGDHIRLGAAAGIRLPVMAGFNMNLSASGYFLDRNELNIGFDTEFLLLKQLGLVGAVGGIKIPDDPQFVYEVGVSGHLAFISLYLGYSDHKGGNEGWFSGAFDTSQASGKGFFLRFVVDV